jgi:hypothetical protein
LARQRSTIQRSGGGASARTFPIGSGSSRMIADMVSAAVFRWKGFWPVVIS